VAACDPSPSLLARAPPAGPDTADELAGADLCAVLLLALVFGKGVAQFLDGDLRSGVEDDCA
jgi:hypothetical protein